MSEKAKNTDVKEKSAKQSSSGKGVAGGRAVSGAGRAKKASKGSTAVKKSLKGSAVAKKTVKVTVKNAPKKSIVKGAKVKTAKVDKEIPKGNRRATGGLVKASGKGRKNVIAPIGSSKKHKRSLAEALVMIMTVLAVIGVTVAGILVSSRSAGDIEVADDVVMEEPELEPEPDPDPTLDYPKVNSDPLVPEPTINDPDAYEVAPYKPRYMSIPSIGMIKIPVVEFGIVNNQLGAPVNVRLMGWWYQSAFPGQEGVSVMDGHGGDLGIGILKELPRAKVGDQIIIEMGDGRKVVYKIKQMIYKKLGDSANDFMSTALFESPEPGIPAMTVITCTGTWLPAVQTYDQRLFVRALLTDEKPVGLDESEDTSSTEKSSD